MRTRFFLLLFVLALVLEPLPAAETFDLGACLTDGDTALRADCLTRRFEDPPVLKQTLRAASELAPEADERVFELFDKIAVTYGEELSEDPGLGAWLLDLRGTTSLRLGRFEAAAGELRQAVSLDDGTSRAISVDLSSGDTRTTTVDVGNGRLERYAEALAAAEGDAAAAPQRERLARLGQGPAAGLLEGPRWYRPVPEISIEIFGAPAFATDQLEGGVTILDFWASWCDPCLDELPHLQALWESERERGLRVVAVNGGEAEQVAVPFAESLGLTMPIGRSSEAVSEVFQVRTLPTLVIVDRQGRIRARWDGYEEGLEEHVAQVTRNLLDEKAAPRIPVAEVMLGSGRLQTAWTRTLPVSIGGIVAVPGEPSGRILLTQGDTLTAFRSDGQTGKRWDTGRQVRRLRHRAAVGARPQTLLGFRPGGTRVARVELPSGEVRERAVPSPILDVAILDDSNAALLGTLEGLLRLEGDRIEPIGEFEVVSAVQAFGDEAEARRLVLSQGKSGGRRISLLDADFSVLSEMPTADDAWGMVLHPALPRRVLVTPPSVVASAAGHLLSPDSIDVALATRSGQLVLLDGSTGEVRFRARWESISDLTISDLDADGLDELIVASASRVTVLESAAIGDEP